MSPRLFLTTGGATFLLWTAGVFAQAPPSSTQKSPARTRAVSRTPDGHPDFEGIWTNSTITPFERPAAFSGKAVLSESEAAAVEEQAADATVDRPPAPGDTGGYNQLWFDRGTKVVPTRRSSREDAAAYARQHPADGPESRSLAERCILWGTAGPPMVPGPYNNNYQIVQGPGYVMILVEMIHDVRFIPTDGTPHLPAHIRQWMGDPRGHWEGDTLVVETTNFTGKTRFRGSDENLRVVEKFRRTDANTLDYQFTIDDPTAFTKPWSADIPMTRGSGALYEYACHEGNYAMTDILSGARAQEKRGQ